MYSKDIYGNWYARWYDDNETQTDDVEFFRELLKGSSKKIFEICCGSGRILLPLAKDGHKMHGIDFDNYMISRLFQKSDGIESINIIQADALKVDFGNGYDVTIMAGNILINIENANTKEEYIVAQKLFIKKSYDCLKPGGYFLMDNGRFNHPEAFFTTNTKPSVRRCEVDSQGIMGENTLLWSKYDIDTQVCIGENVIKLWRDGNLLFEKTKTSLKYIPRLSEMTNWIEDVGFEIIYRWSDYDKSPIEKDTYRAIHWAKKPE